MKGLEEQIEHEEKNKVFMKKIVLHVSAIIISSSFLLNDIINYINNKDIDFESKNK